MRVLLLGATGTIGRATATALIKRRHDVTCFVRKGSSVDALQEGVTLKYGDITEPEALARHGLPGEPFDALISCLASRTGAPEDAWAIDHDAHVEALKAAAQAGVRHVVLLSALCVQRPKLAFQFAKLAFEQKLTESGLTYSIVRPTAFFKSLSGQVARVQAGKSFMVFGDGTLTACKPISDRDLAAFIAECLTDKTKHNRILPIGGPGPAITPLDQGRALFELLGQPPKFSKLPVAAMDAIIGGLSIAGRLVPRLAEKAELARIGRYYGTESMLVWDPDAQRYDAALTPETGSDTLVAHYTDLIEGRADVDLGMHAVF
ncbi:MAG: NAD(P)H-binding protein [Pseudomonadota bacterium]